MGADAQLHSFFTSALDGGKRSMSHPGRFNPRKEPPYLLNRTLGEPQSRSGRLRKEKKYLAFTGIRTLDRPGRSVDTLPNMITSLYQPSITNNTGERVEWWLTGENRPFPMSLVSDVVCVDADRRLQLTACVQAWPDVGTAEAILVFKQLRTTSRKNASISLRRQSISLLSEMALRISVAALNILRGLAWFYSLHPFERRTLWNGPCPVLIIH